MTARPSFIVIEGCDGAGSTTQRDRLVETLTGRGVKVCSTAQPSQLPIGAMIRSMLTGRSHVDPVAFQRLFVADRVDHLARIVEPAMDDGCVVVCDRGELSTVVYHAAGGPADQEIPRCRRALRWHADIAAPTLTIVLAVPAEVAAERRQRRGGPAELFDAAAFQSRVARLYGDADRIVRLDEECRYTDGESFTPTTGLVVIDGTGTIDDVATRVLACVDSRIDLTGSTQG